MTISGSSVFHQLPLQGFLAIEENEMSELSTIAIAEIEKLVADIVEGDWVALQLDGRTGRVTVDEVQTALAGYPGTFRKLPAESVGKFHVFPISGKPEQFAVDVPLWTTEEGYCDLTLSVSVMQTAQSVHVRIDDIHVL